MKGQITCFRCGRTGVQAFRLLDDDGPDTDRVFACSNPRACKNRQDRARGPQWVVLRRDDRSGHRSWEGPYISRLRAEDAADGMLNVTGVAKMVFSDESYNRHLRSTGHG
jgi:hypothetical protein